MIKRYRFRNAVKIKQNKEIYKVLKKGKKHQEKNITSYALHNGKKHIRCAIIIPSKLGSSVYRNNMKRYIREEIRYLSEPPIGFDILIQIHSEKKQITKKAIEESLNIICVKLKGE